MSVKSLFLALSCCICALGSLVGCGGDSQTTEGQDGQPPPNGGAQARATAIYDTSRIRSDSVMQFPDGRQGELFQNTAFQCGQPDVPGDPRTIGVHEFSLIYPIGYDKNNPRPFVLYTMLPGGEVGWIDVDGRYTGTPGTYMGPAVVATAKYNRSRMMEFALDRPFVVDENPGSELVARLKAAHSDWGFMILSYCSHDIYNGMGQGADFPRYGWLAMVDAIKYVNERFGIRHLFVEGGSAGADGTFFLARDFDRALPNVELRGVVSNSGAHELQALAALLDANHNVTLPDLRGGTVSVPCDQSWEPAAVALQRTTTLAGGVPASASEDITAGLVNVPIYHLWGRREVEFCQDEQYSDQLVHGPIARAIVAVNPAQRSENRRVCEEDSDAPLPCGKHAELSGLPDLEPGDRNPDVVADVQAWVERLDSDYAHAITTPRDH